MKGDDNQDGWRTTAGRRVGEGREVEGSARSETAMKRAFLKEARALVERRGALPETTAAPFADWDFQRFIGDKLCGQLERHRELPTLDAVVDGKLEQLLPLYAGLLDSCQADSVQSHMQRFMAAAASPARDGADTRTMKLHNLKAHIIKHELHSEYFEVAELRRTQLSITPDPAASSEMLVHTYTDGNVLELVRLLHDETFLHSSYYNYFRRFTRLFFNIADGAAGGPPLRLSKKLRPADLERLIQQLLYSNKKLSVEERLELRLDKVNSLLLNDLQEAGLKLSNKEMFALLQLTLRKAAADNTASGDAVSASVELLYDKFLCSDKFAKNGDFFTAFLNYNMSLGFSSRRLASPRFCRKVVLDLLDTTTTVPIDRYMLKYLLKYASLVHDADLTRLVVSHLLEHYVLDVETFNMIFAAVLRQDRGLISPVLEQLLHVNLRHTLQVASPTAMKSARVSPPPTSEADRFSMRLLDHLLEKSALVSPQTQPLKPGITHRLPLNPVPQDLLLRSVNGKSVHGLGLGRPVVAEYLRQMSRAGAAVAARQGLLHDGGSTGLYGLHTRQPSRDQSPPL